MHCRKTAPEAGCRFQLTRYIGEREHTSVVELVGPDREDVGGAGSQTGDSQVLAWTTGWKSSMFREIVHLGMR